MHATLENEKTSGHGLLMTDDERTVKMCLSVSSVLKTEVL